MTLPSKELLSKVLEKEVFPLSYVQKGKVLRYCNIGSSNRKRNINIYELMHMMKEYIKSQNLMIIVYHHLDTVAVEIAQNQKSIYTSPGMSVYTEPEAVTKACEWILEQQK